VDISPSRKMSSKLSYRGRRWGNIDLQIVTIDISKEIDEVGRLLQTQSDFASHFCVFALLVNKYAKLISQRNVAIIANESIRSRRPGLKNMKKCPLFEHLKCSLCRNQGELDCELKTQLVGWFTDKGGLAEVYWWDTGKDGMAHVPKFVATPLIRWRISGIF
jgi:hypothetical protein